MSDVSGAWRGRPPEVWVLVVMVLLGSAMCLTGALRPALPETPATLNAVAAALGPILAALLWWPRIRLRTLRIHIAAITKLAVAYALVASAATGEGAMAAATATIWMVLYISAFHPRLVSRVYLVASSMGLGVALAVNPIILNEWASWMVVVLSTIAASEVYSQLLNRARVQAVTDHLTGLPNREGLYRRMESELRVAARHDRPLALAVIDLDGLKEINDREGHLAGDRMLQALAGQLSTGIRDVDGLYRMGGDEFLLLMPETTLVEAQQVLERLHDASATVWSYGVTVVEVGEGLDASLARADRQMYDHKRDRRRSARGTAGPTREIPAPTTV